MNTIPPKSLTSPERAQVGDQFEVFFDGDCPLCRREIDMIRRMDKQQQLVLTDIAKPEFVPPGVPLDTLMREIHGRKADGSFVLGVDVFREIYSRIGFRRYVRPTRWPIAKQLLDLGYWLFAKLRYWHAMHRLKERPTTCGPTDDRTCPTQVPK